MPMNRFDLTWWQWVVCALVCWLVAFIAALRADQTEQHEAFLVSVTWLGGILGVVCA